MMIKFKTFHPYKELVDAYNHEYHTVSATEALNSWLKENPNVEVLDWQTTAVGTTNALYITIQYKTREVCTHD